MRILDGLVSAGETIFGSKFSSAFTAEAMNRARMGETAVIRSHANAAKDIINQAIKADRVGADFKDVAQSISKAINKGDMSGTYKIGDKDLGIGDAINSLIWDGINTNGADKAFADSISKFQSEGMGALYDSFRKGQISAGEALGRKAGEGLGVKGAISGFFGDADYGSTRIKAAIGAGAVGAIGTRYLSGGDLTHNSRGEKDIAGIPFI